MNNNQGCAPGEGDVSLQNLVSLFRQAETGNADRRFELAGRLWKGTGVAKDRDAAEIWYEVAGLDGHEASQMRLGDMWRLGLNGRHSARLAAFWYKQAADGGSADGLYRLACSYRDGDGVPRNQNRWFSLMQKAADEGSVKAMLVLGDHCLSGGTMSKNWTRAIYWYTRAAGAGDVASSFIIGQIYRHGGFGVCINMQEAVRYFRHAAEQGMWQAQVELARTLLYIDPDSQEAGAWLQRGLEYAGEDDVAFAISKVRAGELKIVRWQSPRAPLRIPADELPREAPVELTLREEVFLLSGLGDHNAQLELAELLWKEGNKRNALQWLERSAVGGVAESQYRMALMYQTGVLVEKPREMLAYWCSLAAAQGHKGARELLTSILEAATGLFKRDQHRNEQVVPLSCLPAEIELSDDDIVETQSAGTLYRRVVPGTEPLAVVRLVVPKKAGSEEKVFWVKVPSDIISLSVALSWTLRKLQDARGAE